MDGVRDTEAGECLRLQVAQLFATMIHSTGDTTVLPARVLHLAQLLELGGDLLRRPACRRQRCELCDARPRGHELLLKPTYGIVHLCLDACAYARQRDEFAMYVGAQALVNVYGCDKGPVAVNVEQSATGIAEEKEGKEEVAKASSCQ